MTTALMYVRISRDREGAALGVGRQEAECRELAERHSLTVIDVIVDNDISAYTGGRRPGWETACGIIRAGAVDVLLAWHPDRLTRRPRELEDLVDLLESTRTKVLTVQAGEYDLGTATGRMCARVVGAVARHESEHKGARVSAKRRQDALGGRHYGSRRFGLAADWRTAVTAEVAAVRWAAAEVIAGASLRSIAAGMPAAPLRAPEWSTTALRQMLISPSTAGLCTHRGEVVAAGQWPALLDVATWERVRAILTDPTRRRQPVAPMLLSGIARTTDGRPLFGNRNRNGIARYVARSTPGVGIKAAALDAAVVDHVLRQRARQSSSDKIRPPINPGMVMLADDLAAGRITFEQWRHRRTLLAEQPLLAPPEAAPAPWETLTLSQRRQLILSTLESIVVLPVSRSLPFTDVERIVLSLRRPSMVGGSASGPSRSPSSARTP